MNPKIISPACHVILLLLLLAATGLSQAKMAVAHPAKGLSLETIEWIDDGAEFLDKKRFKTSMTATEKAVDRAAILDGALSRAMDEGRLVLWYVYKISESTKRGRQMIRAPVLDIAMRQIIWSDPDVERIVKANFVPLRMVCDEPMCKRFDLRPLEFLEPSIIVMKSDGEVVHVLRTMRTFEASWFADVLRDILRKVKGEIATDEIDVALDRGEWARALEIEKIGEQDSGSLYRQAVLQRRLRSGDEALELVKEAKAVWEKTIESAAQRLPENQRRRFKRSARTGSGRRLTDEVAAFARIHGQLRAEEGLLLARMGRFDEAIQPLRESADAANGDRRAEAAYLLALLRLRIGDETDASRRFQKIAQDFPDSVHGRRAKANVLLGIDDGRPIGASFSGLERTMWLPEDAYASLPADTRWPHEKLTIQSARDHGVRLLLRQQRIDGGWNDSRYSYCPDARITPNVWVAITALCCQALLQHRDSAKGELRDAIDEAIRRGERYIDDASRLNRGRNEDVYSDAYRLDYYARRLETVADDSTRAAIRKKMTGIIRAAGMRQKESGFWAHEYANAFCTAAMAQGLLAAKKAGVFVPSSILEKAGESIASARSEDGSYSYGGAARGKGSERNLRNSSTRMPSCESILLQLDGSDAAKVRFAFENFWKYYDRIEGVRRTDFHSDGQIAGFMFFHTLYHTSRAINSLPPGERGAQRERLLDRVLRYGEIDGTFMDSHEVGRSYGTAMALIVIADCMAREN